MDGFQTNLLQPPVEGGGNVPQVHGFLDTADRDEHFVNHRDEFDFATAEEYEAAAIAFLEGPMTRTMEECFRKSGDRVRFDKATQILAVCDKDGYIRTFFKPKRSWHHLKSNLKYFRETCKE